MNYNLENRVAIITGATGGIGRAIATELYKEGTSILITGRNIEELDRTREKILTNGSNNKKATISSLPLDLTALDAAKKLVEYTVQEFGHLDILINNAAWVDGCMFLKSDELYTSRMMQINFTTPYHLCRVALPHMLKNKYGRIINITSIAGYAGDAAMSAYAASKGAIASATKSIAAEYGRRGITANCIAPGVIDTDATKKIPAERQKELKASIPSRRFGKPEEVAYLATFLASEQAAYINGQQIHINGGLCR